MSFGSGFIIGQMLGNGNSSYQKHALEQENYELKRKNDELAQKMHLLEQQLQEANKLIKWVIKTSWTGNQEEDDFDRYIEKWGVK